MSNLEYRSYDVTELRSDTEKRTITGKAICYNSMSQPLKTAGGSEFREVIMPGACRDSINGTSDIYALVQHNMEKILGRKSNGTLKIEERDDGVYVEIAAAPTSYTNDLLSLIQRGDISKFSFGFSPTKQRVFSRGDERVREIHNMVLREVSLVPNPCYTETCASLRDSDFVEETPTETASVVDDQKWQTELISRKIKLYSLNQ